MTENNIKILYSYIPLISIMSVLLVINLHKPLKTMRVTKESTSTTLYFSSVINPLNTVIILAPQEGTLVNLYKNYGDKVRKDELLFNIKSPAFETNFRQNVQAYVKAKAAREKALFNYNGNSELYKSGLISKISFMDQEDQLKDSEYNLLDAEQSIKNALLTLGMPFEEVKNLSMSDVTKVKNLYRESLNGIKIRAPASGVLLFSSRTLGTSSNDQSGPLKVGGKISLGQTLGVIANMNGLILKININELDFHAIHVGDPAIITSSALQDIQLTGKITSIDHQATGEDLNAPPTYVVYVTVPELSKKAEEIIEVGMTAQVSLKKPNPAIIQIPISAVINRDNLFYVNVLNPATKKIEMVQVTTGLTDADSVEIISGLNEGSEIVLPH